MAVDDTRARHTALVQLIQFQDQQAVGLLRIFVTIGSAAAAGAVAGFSPQAWLPNAAIGALIAIVLCTLIGSLFCFRAIRSARITLPGRWADFWQTAIDHWEQDSREVILSYLKELSKAQEDDKKTNEITAQELARARVVGISTPLVAFVAGSIIAVQEALRGVVCATAL